MTKPILRAAGIFAAGLILAGALSVAASEVTSAPGLPWIVAHKPAKIQLTNPSSNDSALGVYSTYDDPTANYQPTIDASTSVTASDTETLNPNPVANIYSSYTVDGPASGDAAILVPMALDISRTLTADGAAGAPQITSTAPMVRLLNSTAVTGTGVIINTAPLLEVIAEDVTSGSNSRAIRVQQNNENAYVLSGNTSTTETFRLDATGKMNVNSTYGKVLEANTTATETTPLIQLFPTCSRVDDAGTIPNGGIVWSPTWTIQNSSTAGLRAGLKIMDSAVIQDGSGASSILTDEATSTISRTATVEAASTLTADKDVLAVTNALSGAGTITDSSNVVSILNSGTTSTGSTLRLEQQSANGYLIRGFDSSLEVFNVDDSGAVVGASFDAGASGTITGAVGAFKSNVTIEESGAGTDVITIQAPASIASPWTLTLPDTDGSASQVLTTDGNGITSWTTPSSGGITGSLTANRVPYATGASAVTDSAALYYGAGTGGLFDLNVGSTTGSPRGQVNIQAAYTSNAILSLATNNNDTTAERFRITANSGSTGNTNVTMDAVAIGSGTFTIQNGGGATAFGGTVTASGVITGNGASITAATAFEPDTDGGADLGSSSKHFAAAYFNQEYTGTVRRCTADANCSVAATDRYVFMDEQNSARYVILPSANKLGQTISVLTGNTTGSVTVAVCTPQDANCGATGTDYIEPTNSTSFGSSTITLRSSIGTGRRYISTGTGTWIELQSP